MAEYRELVDWPGYRVGEDGSVWSDRIQGPGPERRRGEWRPLAVKIDSCGHCSVSLRRDGRTFTVRVHQLVLGAFVGPHPEGMECRYKDGNRANSRLDNLAWGAARDRRRGGRTGLPKLTEADIPVVRSLLAAGWTQMAVAARFGVRHTSILNIAHGKTWRHVPGLSPAT